MSMEKVVVEGHKRNVRNVCCARVKVECACVAELYTFCLSPEITWIGEMEDVKS